MASPDIQNEIFRMSDDDTDRHRAAGAIGNASGAAAASGSGSGSSMFEHPEQEVLVTGHMRSPDVSCRIVNHVAAHSFLHFLPQHTFHDLAEGQDALSALMSASSWDQHVREMVVRVCQAEKAIVKVLNTMREVAIQSSATQGATMSQTTSLQRACVRIFNRWQTSWTGLPALDDESQGSESPHVTIPFSARVLFDKQSFVSMMEDPSFICGSVIDHQLWARTWLYIQHSVNVSDDAAKFVAQLQQPLVQLWREPLPFRINQAGSVKLYVIGTPDQLYDTAHLIASEFQETAILNHQQNRMLYTYQKLTPLQKEKLQKQKEESQKEESQKDKSQKDKSQGEKSQKEKSQKEKSQKEKECVIGRAMGLFALAMLQIGQTSLLIAAEEEAICVTPFKQGTARWYLFDTSRISISANNKIQQVSQQATQAQVVDHQCEYRLRYLVSQKDVASRLANILRHEMNQSQLSSNEANDGIARVYHYEQTHHDDKPEKQEAQASQDAHEDSQEDPQEDSQEESQDVSQLQA